ncbi:unnamed protein product [Cylindrotheca closterium]|uniref:Glycosyl transferase CAP10 domain-containing protein n=1 Tax=Cylindrotheca closterium TaxID=2856 RepID=A0AAD2FJU0_9STRA|nr:unnamed protein product [Cylindrotheca closterium]
MMETFSMSSEVQADATSIGGSPTKNKNNKMTIENNNTQSTSSPSSSSVISIRFAMLGLLVGASIWRMHFDKSSYVTAKSETLSRPSKQYLRAMLADNNNTATTAMNGTNDDHRKDQEEEEEENKLLQDATTTTHDATIAPTNEPTEAPNATSPFWSWIEPFWNQRSTLTTASNSTTTTSFVFPDVDFRIKYYMGSWYDSSTRLESVNCSAFDKKFIDGKFGSHMHDKDVLYSYKGLDQQIRNTKHWNIGNYLMYYHTVMKNSSKPQNAVVAMCVGDSSSVKTGIPVAAKTRKAGLVEGAMSQNKYYGIIWPLNMVRHFGPVHDYLELEQVGNVTAWEDKKEALIWRGGYTGVPSLLKGESFRNSAHEYGPRVQAVLANCFQNHSEIDVAFANIPPQRNGIPKAMNKTLMESCMRGTHRTMQEQLEFKYILNVEGNDVSSGLKWQLASNSVVFMAKPMTVSWAMEELLIPFYHYIPVDENFENLPEMIQWAKTHDEEAKKISEQATQYMYDLWISEKSQHDYAELHTLLATRYQDQFGEALWKCLLPSKKSERVRSGHNHNNNNPRSSLVLINRTKNQMKNRKNRKGRKKRTTKAN